MKRKPAKHITGEKLVELIKGHLDPQEFLRKVQERQEELQITTFANLDGLDIEFLPANIIFKGDENRNCASVRGCTKLRSIDSTFWGKLDCSPLTTPESKIPCGLERFNGKIIYANKAGEAADFSHTNIEKLEGSYPGSVKLDYSRVTLVNVTITNPDEDGEGLSLQYCQSNIVNTVRGEVNGSVHLAGTRINTLGPIEITPDAQGIQTQMAGTFIANIDLLSNLTEEGAIGADQNNLRKLHALELVQRIKGLYPDKIDPSDGRVITTGDEPACPELIEAALLLMESSQTEARRNDKNHMPYSIYTFLSKAARPWIDLTEGGLSKLGKKTFTNTPRHKTWENRFKTAENLHKKHNELKHRILAVRWKFMKATPETKEYYDEKTDEMTDLGKKVFGNLRTQADNMDVAKKAAKRAANRTKIESKVKGRLLKAALAPLAVMIAGATVEWVWQGALNKTVTLVTETAKAFFESKELPDNKKKLDKALIAPWSMMEKATNPVKEGEKTQKQRIFGEAAEAHAVKLLDTNPTIEKLVEDLGVIAAKPNTPPDELLGMLMAWYTLEEQKPGKHTPVQKDALRDALIQSAITANRTKPKVMEEIQTKIRAALNPPIKLKSEMVGMER